MALADKMLEWSDRLRERAEPGLSEEEEIRAAIRRLRQANLAGVLANSDHRAAAHCQAEWKKLASHAEEPHKKED